MNSTEAIYTAIPLGATAHLQARQFAAEQSTPQKGKQTYLNTLAVYAVHQYLQWLQIDTDLTQGDCWHPGKRALFDIADLVLPNLGKLECRPVLPGSTLISLPFEAMQDRIGYVAVQFNESLNEAHLLGFIQATDFPDTAEQLAIAQLQPMDVLLEYLPDVVAESIPARKMRVNLSQWLQNAFEVGWQSLDTLLGINQPVAFSLRSSAQSEAIQRAKLIDLGLQLENQSVILLVAVAPDIHNSDVEILVQLHPVPEEPYLPPNLQLHLLSETGEALQTVRSRQHDNYIQLRRFQGTPGECFDIQLTLGTTSLTETFVI
ncbi:MAG TPA: DUF1822 family protein [Leptolyngbyaceae cyanobacterium M33_DOE_097]|uniref:DUF1822 family protein n=1 Tax=Oscillatoriales cyanobacterium SpSt-418 TaxID=2282169 RepID=A0A7C3PMI2_9CYAN|nr:DUF1822 family protein [Leptolyngbyaceae cyanobacterium M33_DOE_097]